MLQSRFTCKPAFQMEVPPLLRKPGRARAESLCDGSQPQEESKLGNTTKETISPQRRHGKCQQVLYAPTQ